MMNINFKMRNFISMQATKMNLNFMKTKYNNFSSDAELLNFSNKSFKSNASSMFHIIAFILLDKNKIIFFIK